MTFLVGAARRCITPVKVHSMAGYSVGSPRATEKRKWEDLHATALYACSDAEGDPEEVVICCVDLHAGMRPLWITAARKVEAEVGIPKGRIVLTGTHTHTAPGQMYGSMYDLLAQDDWFLDDDLVERTSALIAEAIIEAKQAAVPGHLTVATTKVWGFGSNQSLPAHSNHPRSRQWYCVPSPGADPPAGLSAVERATDPRLTALLATDDDHRVVGVIGLFGTHATALGPKTNYYSPDWCGVAYETARQALEAADVAREGIQVGIGASCMGDVGPLPLMASESGRPAEQGKALQEAIGARVGTALAELVQLELGSDRKPSIRVAHTVWEVDPEHDPKLAEWSFGWPTVGGSEDGRSFLSNLVKEGDQDDALDEDHPQYPKHRLPRLLKLFRLKPPNRFPLHVVWLDDQVLATVPGEPTVLAGWQIEEALRAIDGIGEVRILGYSNEYGGYFTTTEEFEMQHYEGSSTIYGRYQVDRLTEELVELASNPRIDTSDEPPFEQHGRLKGWLGFCKVPPGLRR